VPGAGSPRQPRRDLRCHRQPEDKLRIIMNPTGGSFGNTITANTYSLVATAVQNLGIPAR